MPGPDSRGPSVPWDDADCGGAVRAAERRRVSAGDVCGKPVRYAAVNRADGAGASEVLSRAGRFPAAAACAVRRDTRLENAIRDVFGASAKSDIAGDQPVHRADSV